jgi:ATP-dependent Lhr-like helicase
LPEGSALAALAESQARVFLTRYGVLARECAGWEDFFDWGSLAPQLSRMELRGEIRQGYFVAGLSGIQYALPEAVESLRAASKEGPETEDLVVLNATDPANICVGEVPASASPSRAESPREERETARAFSGEEWLRFHRLPSTHVVWAGGRPILVAEDGGQRISTLNKADTELVQRALQAYLARPNAPRRVILTQWNGEDALGGPAETILKPIGFHRTPHGLESP